MFTLVPIADNIQSTLHQKIAMLSTGMGGIIGRDSNNEWVSVNLDPLKDQSDSPENYMYARTPYMKMTSFTPGPNYMFNLEPGPRNKYGQPIILMGGELNRHGNIESEFFGGKYSYRNYGCTN